MIFLRRFLAPILLSSLLIVITFPLLGGGDPADLLRENAGDWVLGIAFAGLFVIVGLFLIGYPAAYFLARRDLPLWIALPILLVVGAGGGAAICFLFATVAGGSAGDGLILALLIGSLPGMITAVVWSLLNADLYRGKPRDRADG